MLFPKAIPKAEWEADAPLREALAIKRERLRARRAEKEMRGNGAASEPPHIQPADVKECPMALDPA